jgi:hypothetical protein
MTEGRNIFAHLLASSNEYDKLTSVSHVVTATAASTPFRSSIALQNHQFY